jgi:cell division protein FtsW
LSAVILVAVEPDLGTAGIVASVSFALYFLSGARWREVLGILFLLLALIVFLIKIEPYRLQRFSGFASFNPGNLNQAPYHIRQVLIALGSGGLTGVGIGRSTQKYAYVPENTTDSIFAMWAEETGFLGSMFLLLLFLLQLFTSFLVGLRAQSRFGKLLVFGIAIFLSFQTLLNLASQVALVPLTGIPLPFVSYGGSSMVINFSAIGIVMSVANRDLV